MRVETSPTEEPVMSIIALTIFSTIASTLAGSSRSPVLVTSPTSPGRTMAGR